jgi:hypothetical protein
MIQTAVRTDRAGKNSSISGTQLRTRLRSASGLIRYPAGLEEAFGETYGPFTAASSVTRRSASASIRAAAYASTTSASGVGSGR